MGVAIISVGCNLSPKYNRPSRPVPAEWPKGEAYEGTSSATSASDAPALKWQEFFADEKLQKLIETALKNNRDLRLAALNVERAQAQYGIQRGELFPAFRLVGAGSKQSLPADLSNSGRRTTVEQYSANLAVLSWELDFFGRIRSLSDRALEEYLATEQARRSAQILLVSGVANAYLALAADREHLRLAETTLETQQAAYDLVKRRHDLGLATELDLYRAQTQVDAAQVELARFRQLVALDENALNLLLGSPSPSELLPSELGNATVLKEISPGVSSEALLRRPDVLQAENLLKATHANIGAARANFFPRISLTAAAGTASDDLSGLFKSGSGTWSFAPQILMPVFDARLRPGLKGAHVQREIALTQYEKAIQNAFREVADALALRGTVNQQLSAQESLVKAVSETHRLSNSRYDKGVDSYLSVLDAQRSLYAAQQGLITLRLAKLAHHIRLYAALGGGWEAADASPTTASASSTTEP